MIKQTNMHVEFCSQVTEDVEFALQGRILEADYEVDTVYDPQQIAGGLVVTLTITKPGKGFPRVYRLQSLIKPDTAAKMMSWVRPDDLWTYAIGKHPELARKVRRYEELRGSPYTDRERFSAATEHLSETFLSDNNIRAHIYNRTVEYVVHDLLNRLWKAAIEGQFI